MTIISKFDLDDNVVFLVDSIIESGTIVKIMSTAFRKENEENPTINIQYIARTPQDIDVLIYEANAFKSKEELIKVITDRFNKSLGEWQA